MITRALEKSLINKDFRHKVQVVLGARQVGKTTMVHDLIKQKGNYLFLNCDDEDDRMVIEDKTTTEIQSAFEKYDYVFIDEAQRVKNIGLIIKKIGDLKLNAKVFVTGSSSLDLANGINEPATGRTMEYTMYPLSLSELATHTSQRDEKRMLSQRLIYGTYPDVVNYPAEARTLLKTLTNNYLYKDILSYKGMKKPEALTKLVKALALQVGSEVSYNELANLIGIDKETVENYITLLEKCFVLFRLDSYSRNLRNEIKKGKKVYFYDNGIRNAVISNFAPADARTDMGALWENLMISERIKRNAYLGSYAQLYFWRTHDQSEVDLIEDMDGVLHTYEFKFRPGRKAKLPKAFAENYPDSTFDVVTPDNYWDFVL
ncbi:MAG: ATP-binding protein [Paludibacteraceae bacterium]|nr:ATP-binding protein [Paludibacteraceae bacterium]